MTRTHLARMGASAAALALGVTATAFGLSGPASAQTPGCAGVPVSGATVRIDSPTPNSVVWGTVQVHGTAEPALGAVNRVDVTFGDSTHTASFDPITSDFSASFDTAGMDPGPTTVKAVACGMLARGESQVNVRVQSAPVVPTSVVGRSSTTVAPSPGQGVTSTTSATPTTKVGQPAVGQASSTSSPPVTDPRVEVFKPEPVRPKSGPDAPLVLTETPARHSPRPPLWVGAVVGVSGALGLAFSAASWRRRAHAPEVAEPLDPDLVEVG